jgi:hypothetical protein
MVRGDVCVHCCCGGAELDADSAQVRHLAGAREQDASSVLRGFLHSCQDSVRPSLKTHSLLCLSSLLPSLLPVSSLQMLRKWAFVAGGIYVGGFLCLWLPEVLLCPTGSHVPVVSLPWTRHLNLHALFHLTSSVTCLPVRCHACSSHTV